MSHWLTNALRAVMEKEIDLQVDDIRATLVMTNTTVDTEEDVALMNAFTTLDEFDGTGFARVALTTEAVTADNPNNRGKFDADDVVFSVLNADATRDVAGVLIYFHVTNDTDSVPLLYIDTGGFPYTATGADLTINFHADGIAYLQG